MKAWIKGMGWVTAAGFGQGAETEKSVLSGRTGYSNPQAGF